MEVNWKDPSKESPQIELGKGSVCVMVTPGHGSAQYPVKAWWNGDGHYWMAGGGTIAEVDGWDYYPEHIKQS